ncbi:MAG: NlpC/P60 family protein [Verrucomicrobiota bacterium]|nr:NlpC/P60 family protein [Verrucomicrobiota bacterium]
MKRKLRFAFVIVMTVAMSTALARGTQEQEESFGSKLKKLFIRQTPTPKHRKRKKTSPTPAIPPSPSVSPSQTSASAAPSESPRPTTTATIATETRQAIPVKSAQTQYLEPVRPISPRPHSRRRATPTTTPSITSTITTSPTSTPTPAMTSTPAETPVSRPASSLPPMIKSAPSPVAKKISTPNAAISLAEISGSESYSPDVGKIIDLGLNLTTQNLGYKYASADPSKGGMDCSGFIYYVLSKSGIKGVPRDAREQYVWVRKAGTFEAVLAQRDDSFELDALKPGDLLFWATPYSVSREPDVIQTMIYLGRDKATNQRLMVGASEGRTYKGQMRKGISVFDFKIGRTASKASKEPASLFVGYGRIPGLGAH